MKTSGLLACAALLGLGLFAGCGPTPFSTYKSTKGGFSVKLPGKPKKQTQTAQSPLGPLKMHLYILEEGPLVAFNVMHSDYPKEVIELADVELMLDGARDGAVKAAKGKLLDEKKVAIDEWPGREFSARVNKGKSTLRTRIFMVENRLYQVGWVGPHGDAKGERVTEFLDSFKLLGK